MPFPKSESLPGDSYERRGIALHTTLVFESWTQKAELRTVLRDALYDSHPELEALLLQTLKTFVKRDIRRKLDDFPEFTVSAGMVIFDLTDDANLCIPPLPRDLIRSEIFIHSRAAYIPEAAALLATSEFKQGLFKAVDTFFRDYLRVHGQAEDCIALQHRVDSFLR
jgi:hypothetical protein